MILIPHGTCDRRIVLRRISVVVLLLMFIPLFNLPPATGDVAIVPGGMISDNTLHMSINVSGQDTLVVVTNSFNLHSYTDNRFTTSVAVENGTLMNGFLEEPGNATVSEDGSGLQLYYSTYNDTTDTVSFSYGYSLHFNGSDGFNFTRYVHSSAFYKLWTWYFAYVRDLSLIIDSNVWLTTYNGTCHTNGTHLELSYLEGRQNHPFNYVYNLSLTQKSPSVTQIKGSCS